MSVRRLISWSWKLAFVGLAVLALALMSTLPDDRPAHASPATETVPAPTSASSEPTPTDVLGPFGIEVTAGAAAGYVPDPTCRTCHFEQYNSYQEVGMAQSFGPPSEARRIENFDAKPYFHALSKRYYQMRWRGDELWFHRWQLDDDGQPTHVFERRVDWILGSGHTSRTYLYLDGAGRLFQLPIAWYSQGEHWAMAPGFDWPDHQGVERMVRYECMFCHNAYAEIPAGADRYGSVQDFPTTLPAGTGCQRCHGPGAEHVATVFGGGADVEAIRAAIVNPARLEPQRRREVCYQCHLQTSVALPGVRRFDRGVFSYRPGEPLSDYLVRMDSVEEGLPRADRFEINHHPYRLEQSRCFVATSGGLDCMTCHDPHRKVPSEARAQHYRQACLTCHQELDCGRHVEGTATAENADCTACHMPRRRTQDVIHVAMTDHKIQLPPAQPARLLEPLNEKVPTLTDVEFTGVDPPTGELAELYRAMAVVRVGGGQEAVDALRRSLGRVEVESIDPWLALARGEIRLGRYQAATSAAEEILQRVPADPVGTVLLASARSKGGDHQAAIALLRQAVERSPDVLELRFGLGRALVAARQSEEARRHLQLVAERLPESSAAWLLLGQAQALAGDHPIAASSLRRCLEINPLSDAARKLLVFLEDRQLEDGHAEAGHGEGGQVKNGQKVLK